MNSRDVFDYYSDDSNAKIKEYIRKEEAKKWREAYDFRHNVKFEDLLGKTLLSCKRVKSISDKDELYFITDKDESFILFHNQDCCESVFIEDLCGDLEDLVGSPLLLAEEVINEDTCEDEEQCWTFYKLSTIKGSVTIRWYGSSNGYYSVSVNFERIS